MKRILVALDTTGEAGFVLDRALEIARPTNGKLRLLRVIPDVTRPPAPSLLEPAGDSNARVVQAEEDLRFIEEGTPERSRDGLVVEVGEPAAAICHAARAYNADLVVIGAHRHGIVDRVLGTTAAAVVNRIDRPVLVVRPKPAARRRQVQRAPAERAGLPRQSFPMLGAAALTGAAAGVATGAIAGPPGAIVGGTIGLAAGMLAGSTLEVEDAKTFAHDGELDADIGVTDGDIGAREAAAKALDACERRAATELVAPELSAVGRLLADEHARLDEACAALLWAYRSDDWSEVQAQWRVFEPLLRAHIALEEERVLPVPEGVDAEETFALRAEHAALVALLDTISVGIELHAFPVKDAEELIHRLRAHAAREEGLLYPWVEALASAPADKSAA